MIARFTLLLPFSLHVRIADEFQSISGEQDGYRYVLHPLKQADIQFHEITRETPLKSITPKLVARVPAIPSGLVFMDEGPTFEANLVQIDFARDDFDRPSASASRPESEGDPPPSLAIAIANRLLTNLRLTNISSVIRPVEFHEVYWRLEYLTDQEEPIPSEAGKIRSRYGSTFHERFVGVTPQVWDVISRLPPEYEPPIWAKLLLDADAAMPDIGAAVVLAATAIETIAKRVSDAVADDSNLPPGLWDWINNRGNYLKEPSVEERLDTILKILTGSTLKQHTLWPKFKELKTARNNCVHEGRPAVGGKLLTEVEAHQLIQHSSEIIGWLEQYLPPAERWKRARPVVQWRVTRPVS